MEEVQQLSANWPDLRIVHERPITYSFGESFVPSTFIQTPWHLWIQLLQWNESLSSMKATEDQSSWVIEEQETYLL